MIDPFILVISIQLMVLRCCNQILFISFTSEKEKGKKEGGVNILKRYDLLRQNMKQYK